MSVEAERLLELETRSMYQEATMAELSAVVAAQEARIQRLEESIRGMARRLKDMAGDKPSESLPHERPPHY